MDWVTLEDQYASGVYAKRGLAIVSGQGATLTDDHGRVYIDCVGGQGTANIGHVHPRWLKALTDQAGVLLNCPEMFSNDQRALYMQELLSAAPFNMQRVFFCNSGAEAIEGALKFARAATGRTQIIAAKRAFHGRTMGALSATWNKKYRDPFLPLVPDFNHITFNEVNDLETITEKTAAVLLEVIQGEGGVYPIDPAYLQAVRETCDRTGALLIVDEVQTGFGRTGKLFAVEHFGVPVDLLCVAKSMAGGLPMGAILMGPKVGRMEPGIHGSTFGGNPLVCAAARETLKILQEEHLIEQAAVLGVEFQQQLRAIQSPLIRDVRGMGLIVGVELKQKVAPYIKRLTELGVLALPAGMTVLRFLPPLVISREQLNQVAAAVTQVLTEG
ncbi:MAG: aspartate aminotransferase family protein [Chloroflexi bacterium HGW-Chloroflexi-10]|nr:MAG: aspartate aminotransferase family protein [Chloroflexi bacterium HGW-Chloroflexi-10]